MIDATRDILGALFADPGAAQDDALRLAPVAAAVSGLGCEVLWLIQAPSRTLATVRCRPTGAQPPRDLAGSIFAQLGSNAHCVFAHPDAKGSVFAVALAASAGESVALAGTLPGPPEVARPAILEALPLLESLGLLAAMAVQSRRAEAVSAERVRQLQREQVVLKASHVELVDSAIKEREARLRIKEEYAEHLEREVALRSADLHTALQRAEAANQAKTQFLTHMSHELRTPLTAILGFTDKVIADSWGRQRILEPLAAVRRNGAHLLEIVDDLLDISALEASALEIKLAPVSPGAMLNEVIAAVQARAQEKGLVLDVMRHDPWPELITTDPQRLRQVLTHLIGNAIKFTERGSVRVEARLVQDPDRLRIDINDTGVGIHPESLDRLFQPFLQGDSSMSRARGGAGLGLFIARSLARLMGGDVTATSEPGRGSCFTALISADPVQFTAASPQAPAAERSVDQNPSPAGPPAPSGRTDRILLAEDMPDNRMLVTFLLRGAHYEVVPVENGKLAVTRALDHEHGEPFDLIIMDMQMPVMDGYAATHELRTRGFSKPIIALTAHAMAGDRERCLSAGCDEYQTKPVNAPALLATIGRLIAASRGATQIDPVGGVAARTPDQMPSSTAAAAPTPSA